jgi:hypothetical protein
MRCSSRCCRDRDRDVIGVVVLGQIPSALEALGVGLVVGAVAFHRDELPERAREPKFVQDRLRLLG